MPLYFAYGSNMNVDQLSARAGERLTQPLFVASLPDYAIGFTRYSDRQGGGVADIVQSPGNTVWGVVFELSEDSMSRLDAAEGVRLVPAAYRRLQIVVSAHIPGGQLVHIQGGQQIQHGDAVGVLSYEVIDKQLDAPVRPSSQYLLGVIASAARWHLSPDYIWHVAMATRNTQKFSVDDVKVGAKDAAESVITRVYTKVVPEYAVYQNRDRVAVQYSDDQGVEAEQRKAISKLNLLRAEINGLIGGWRDSNKRIFERRTRRYDGEVAAALVECLEGDADSPLTSLTRTRDDLRAERTSWGMSEYLISAAGAAAFAFLIFTLLQRGLFGEQFQFKIASDNIWLAARAGTIGALFSVAIGMRKRTILPNIRKRDNISDAILRITVGAVAAGVLILLVASGILPTVSFADIKISGKDITWQIVLIIGFAAGFIESLVPGILEKAAPPPPAPGAAGAAGTLAATGATGATGTHAATGATGTHAATGATGTTRTHAATGSTGTTGTHAATGATGTTGTHAATGSTGATGNIGETGAIRATGTGSTGEV